MSGGGGGGADMVEVRTTSSGDPVLRRIYRGGEETVPMVVCLRGQAEG